MNPWERCANEARVDLIKAYQRSYPDFSLEEERKGKAMSRYKLAMLLLKLNSGVASQWASAHPGALGDVA